MLKIIAAVLLILLGVYMIFLGQQASIRAPIVTGLGFFVIAGVFLEEARAASKTGDR